MFGHKSIDEKRYSQTRKKETQNKHANTNETSAMAINNKGMRCIKRKTNTKKGTTNKHNEPYQKSKLLNYYF